MLDEQWVHEDTLNAMSELVYFQRAVLSTSLPPDFLFLPTTFFADASHLFSQNSKFYSPNLTALRRRVALTKVHAVGFLVLKEGHFSAVWIDVHGVFFADSLSHAPPEDLMPLLSWVFQGTYISIPESINIVEVPQQTYALGNGSCGIAAHNFIHRHAFEGVKIWDALNSISFRDAALEELILFHLCASDRKDVRTLYFLLLPIH